jgi:hypothetical protein
MAKKIDIEEFDDSMEEDGYLPEARKILLEQAETIEPGQQESAIRGHNIYRCHAR